MLNSEYTAIYNAHACYYMNFSGVCKKTGKGCIHFFVDRGTISDCDEYVNRNKAVSKNVIPKKLMKLINENPCNMIFVENDDDMFSVEELNDLADLVVLRYPVLSDYIEVDFSGNGDFKIMVYWGIGSILV